MNKSLITKDIYRFLIFSVIIFLCYTAFLIYSGYFEIGLLSDDYLNFIGAQHSSLYKKFTSSIPLINKLHFRPLYYISINFSIWINQMLNMAKDNFILFRIENMLFFYFAVFLTSLLFFRITKRIIPSVVLLLMCILYPSNINDICWTVGKNDLMCAVFLMSSLIFAFSYSESRTKYSYYLAGLFFALGLLTKETSVILPFITILLLYIAYSKEKIFELKNLLIMEIFILIFYFSIRIYILGIQPAESVSKFQRPGLSTSFGVAFKAFISMLLPFDYLTIQEYLSNVNYLFIIYVFLLLIFVVAVLFIFIRTNNFKYLFLLCLVFLVSVSPNLIAGYFRPQLIFIPFILLSFSLLLIGFKMGVNLKFYLINLLMIFFIWGKLSFNLIQDWKLAYNDSIECIKSMTALDLDTKKRNIFIGIPSRFRQASMLDYTMGAYNYWKYGEFKINDKIIDLVLTGALDAASLNSEISVSKLSENEFELLTSGETQYFLRLDAANNKYKDKDIALRLSEKNLFKKPTDLKLRLTSEDADVYLYSQKNFTKIIKENPMSEYSGKDNSK
ncbi:MAG TPA: glycosyltransferase family 39 protein [Ignavibacteria bacterium]|nr:glycosyltransferase family 39 protein [Ignavibacteria bacterium]